MNILKCLRLSLVMLAAAPAFAAEPAPSEQGFKYVRDHISVIVNDDGSQEITCDLAMTVLRDDAKEYMKQMPINYSASAEKVRVIEAYTKKADGKRIDAAPNSFQVTTNGGREGAPPAFSDQAALTVIFPDVDVGDTVYIVYKREVTQPIFPKQFSDMHQYYKDVAYDDALLQYSVPLALNVKYKNTGMTETVNKREDGRQILEWTFKNPEAKTITYSVPPVTRLTDNPGVLISTFPSYASIVEAYGARARTKAAVTPQIQKLADKITAGKKEPRAQAKALYDWMTDNITYAGNCIGLGSVVPRDIDFVLQNKMGDCKDHATLLQALLKAKGIESSQALIGANTIYELPDVPLVQIANHVINYIPAFNLYVDATSKLPFGMLPHLISGKPVLLVDGYKEGMKTPAEVPGMHKIQITSKVAISEDGTAAGVTSVVLTGETAYGAKERFEQIAPERMEEISKNMLKNAGFEGSAEMKLGPWDEDKRTYSYNIVFKLKDYAHIGSPGALNITPPFAMQNIITTIASQAQQKNDKVDYDFLCGNILMMDNYTYEFPKNMSILAVPGNFKYKTSVQDYGAEYVLTGQKLVVTRTLNDTTPGPTCKPEIMDAYIDLGTKAWPNVKSQIVYK